MDPTLYPAPASREYASNLEHISLSPTLLHSSPPNPVVLSLRRLQGDDLNAIMWLLQKAIEDGGKESEIKPQARQTKLFTSTKPEAPPSSPSISPQYSLQTTSSPRNLKLNRWTQYEPMDPASLEEEVDEDCNIIHLDFELDPLPTTRPGTIEPKHLGQLS